MSAIVTLARKRVKAKGDAPLPFHPAARGPNL